MAFGYMIKSQVLIKRIQNIILRNCSYSKNIYAHNNKPLSNRDLSLYNNKHLRSISLKKTTFKNGQYFIRSFHCSSERNNYLVEKLQGFKKTVKEVTNEVSTQTQPDFFPDGKTLLERFVFVKTLENFYGDFENGIIVDCNYMDNMPGMETPHMPVVLALHDTPGRARDLLPLLTTLARLGCRTVAPTYPCHGHSQGLMSTYDDIFSQSSAERALFVKDFLDTLHIDKVACVVGVGASSYTALHLVTGQHADMFQSLALVSPWPIDRARYEGYSKVSYILQNLYDRPPIRTPLMMALSTVRTKPHRTSQDKINSAFLMNNLNLEEALMCAQLIPHLNIPRLVVYPGLDPEVERSSYVQLMEELGIPDKNVQEFEGSIAPSLLPGGVMFPEDGYDIYKTRGKVISVYLSHLVQLHYPQISI